MPKWVDGLKDHVESIHSTHTGVEIPHYLPELKLTEAELKQLRQLREEELKKLRDSYCHEEDE